VEISIVSLNNVTARQSQKKKLGTFLENKVFQKSKFSEKEINKSWSPSPIFFTEKQHLNFEMFEEVVHNFGKSDSDII